MTKEQFLEKYAKEINDDFEEFKELVIDLQRIIFEYSYIIKKIIEIVDNEKC